MLNANTKARFALFNRAPQEDDKPDTVYPIMTGFVESATFKKNVAAFAKINPNNGKKFLSLVIANKDDVESFSGMLHKDEKDGKEGHYFGYISQTFCLGEVDGKVQYEQSEWQLGINARIKAPEGKKKHIGGDVYPLNKSGSESANQTEGEALAF